MEEKSKLLVVDGDQAAAAMDLQEASSSPAPASSLLRYVAQACAGCLLRMCGGRDADAADGTADDPTPAGADGGGKTSEDLRINSELLQTRRSKARPKPPGNPREGRGGGGGSHN